MSALVTPSEHGAWWTIHSQAIMEMLYAVHNGRSPESVYVEAYNNSRPEEPDSDN